MCSAIHYQLRSLERQRIPREQLQELILEFHFCECPAYAYACHKILHNVLTQCVSRLFKYFAALSLQLKLSSGDLLLQEYSYTYGVEQYHKMWLIIQVVHPVMLLSYLKQNFRRSWKKVAKHFCTDRILLMMWWVVFCHTDFQLKCWNRIINSSEASYLN